MQSFVKVKIDHIYHTPFGNGCVSQSQKIRIVQLQRFRTGRNSGVGCVELIQRTDTRKMPYLSMELLSSRVWEPLHRVREQGDFIKEN